MPLFRLGVLLWALLFPVAAFSPAAALQFPDVWPSPGTGAGGERVGFTTSSPFTIAEAGKAAALKTTATYFTPRSASASAPVPAVVLLHGASGVKASRSLAYAQQFAEMGGASLVLDAFSPRRELAMSFTDRLVEITEAMLLADAYAGLKWLDERPEIDGERIAMMGFSYGGMAALYAAQRQVADAYAPGDSPRFAAHIAFYAPCIVRFQDAATTGAPILMLMGSDDQIVDLERCGRVAEEMREGGSEVEEIVYEGARHMWDGGPSRPWRARHHLADCRLAVQPDGTAYDENTWMPMRGPLTRKLILALCINDDGYLIQGDDTVRARSNTAVAGFLSRHLSSSAKQ